MTYFTVRKLGRPPRSQFRVRLNIEVLNRAISHVMCEVRRGVMSTVIGGTLNLLSALSHSSFIAFVFKERSLSLLYSSISARSSFQNIN